MRVLNVSAHADTGGTGIRTKQAFARVAPDVDYYTTCRTSNYLAYPQDLPWDKAHAAWMRSDVVHLRESFEPQVRLGVPDRPTVLHHHGTTFRRNRSTLLREQRRRHATGLAATLDLVVDAPDDLIWMPAPYDLTELARIRALTPVPDDDVLRIAHAPTNRAVKSTEFLIEAVQKLRHDVDCELILIEGTSWVECLRLKAQADVYFDQALLGYGNNAIEAWGMGIPVIAGGAPSTLNLMAATFGSLPFLTTDPGGIYEALLALCEPTTRTTWARAGREHARRWHSQETVVPMLQAVYSQVLR